MYTWVRNGSERTPLTFSSSNIGHRRICIVWDAGSWKNKKRQKDYIPLWFLLRFAWNKTFPINRISDNDRSSENSRYDKTLLLASFLHNNANHLLPKTEPINSFDESLFEWRKLVPTAKMWLAWPKREISSMCH